MKITKIIFLAIFSLPILMGSRCQKNELARCVPDWEDCKRNSPREDIRRQLNLCRSNCEQFYPDLTMEKPFQNFEEYDWCIFLCTNGVYDELITYLEKCDEGLRICLDIE